MTKMTKQAMVKRAAHKAFFKEAVATITEKYSGSEVTQALCEVAADDLTELFKRAHPDDDCPAISFRVVGTTKMHCSVDFND